jgi:hypothetical protein
MSKELALHIEDLRAGLENTHQAEDRSKFISLLAYAAILLAKIELEAPKSEIFDAIDTFDRLWGQTWVECWNPESPESYELFKKKVGYPAT